MVMLETVTVKREDGSIANINKEDFREGEHTLIKSKRRAGGPVGGVNVDLLLDRVDNATTIDDITQVEMWLSGKGPEFRTPELLGALASRRIELTTVRERGHVEARVIHADPEPMAPYLAPASHNRNASRDQGSVFDAAGATDPGYRDPISGAKSEEELDRLAESIEARRQALKKEQELAEDAGSDEGGDVLDGTVGDVREHVATLDNEADLDALEKAEKKGAKRAGVLDAIDKRRAALKAE
jgi:hypothetical protein